MKRNRKKAGLPPGSVVFTGNQRVEKVQIHYLQYDSQHFEEESLNNHSDIIFRQSKEDTVDWYDIRGIHDTKLIERVGEIFGIHSLVLEDVVDTQQRPKFEEYEKGVLLIFKALSFNHSENKIATEQIALYFRKGLVITFQEDHTDIFAAVRQRIHSGKGKVRQRGADYLTYALADNLVDNYYVVLDQVAESIETLEDNLLDNPDSQSKEKIHHLKKEVIRVRKSIAPLREAISRFSKSDSPFIEESSTFFI